MITHNDGKLSTPPVPRGAGMISNVLSASGKGMIFDEDGYQEFRCMSRALPWNETFDAPYQEAGCWAAFSGHGTEYTVQNGRLEVDGASSSRAMAKRMWWVERADRDVAVGDKYQIEIDVTNSNIVGADSYTHKVEFYLQHFQFPNINARCGVDFYILMDRTPPVPTDNPRGFFGVMGGVAAPTEIDLSPYMTGSGEETITLKMDFEIIVRATVWTITAKCWIDGTLEATVTDTKQPGGFAFYPCIEGAIGISTFGQASLTYYDNITVSKTG